MPVYFIQAADGTGPIKIGFSGNPERRLRSIQYMSPVSLVILKVIPGERGYEDAIHQYFADSRLHGEWFKVTDRLMKFILQPYDIPSQPPAQQEVRHEDTQEELGTRYTLSGYLYCLMLKESSKPLIERRHVPSAKDLAEEAGISEDQLMRIIKGDAKTINLSVTDSIIRAMRERGFDTNVTDLLEYQAYGP